MERRSFISRLGLIAAAGLPAVSAKRKRKRLALLGARDRGIILYVQTARPPGNWRDVPPDGVIARIDPPVAIGQARQAAKLWNRRSASERGNEWAVVVVTDGRKGGVA